MDMLMIALAVALVGFEAAAATDGVDVSTAVSEDSWKCINDQNYTFAIVRIYQSNGVVDPNGTQTILNARAAGFENVDAYIFPCKRCGNPREQIKAAAKELNDKGAKIGQLWIDIEGETWTNDPSDNLKFIQEMIDEVRVQKFKAAMYTNKKQWESVAGQSAAFKDLQLWYAHFNGNANFNDFEKFGGWENPAIKQYEQNAKVCGVGVDKNWYP